LGVSRVRQQARNDLRTTGVGSQAPHRQFKPRGWVAARGGFLARARACAGEAGDVVKAEVRAASGVDRIFDEGHLMADYEVQALVEQLSTRGNESFLFELGLTIREAAERATRDADRVRREVERSDDPDRSFHDGRASE
jgi:hypothetical protein